ncbi:MAG: ABC transporter ATP-binding protein [Candidatus Heimdallarchaeaceae archaeon]
MIRCNDIIKIYHDEVTGVKVAALRGLDLNVKEGELVSIIGPSGAGKTTLIKILSGLETPTGGTILIDGRRLDQMSEPRRREFRFYNIGLVNQFISDNLFSRLSVKQNLLIPKKVFYLPREQSLKEVEELIKILNLEHVKENQVAKLSGGEAMRLSLGVALSKNPKILLADEPTGQLDTVNTEELIETIKQINLSFGKTILVVTHDIRYRTIFEKSFIIRDGRLVGISKDIERDELEFLLHSSDINKSYLDPSNFVRIPDDIKSVTALGEVVEFDVHPSKKLGLFWNPEILPRDEVYKIISSPVEEFNQKVDEVKFEDVEYLLAREFIPPKKKKTILKLKGVTKGYSSRAGYNEIIKNMDLSIDEQDFVFISGPSGVGKTTLLNLIAGLIQPEKGTIELLNFKINEESEKKVSLFRLHNIAYISQHNNLFEPIQVKDNLLLPTIFSKNKYDVEYGRSISKECHIDYKLNAFPEELSAGETQRASLAAALSRKTKIILADEPTANLDSELARTIMDLLMDTVRINKATLITCSHDLSLLRPGFRHIRLLDGKIVEDTRISKKDLEGIIREYLMIKSNKKKKTKRGKR